MVEVFIYLTLPRSGGGPSSLSLSLSCWTRPISVWSTAQHHILQALLASLFTWGVAALGATPVLFTKREHQGFQDAMLGFSAGVMLAASFWSLLAPAIELSKDHGRLAWFPAATGFGLGACALGFSNRLPPHFQLGASMQAEAGVATTWGRTMRLVLAITLHNIPEGLAIGVAFGASACGMATASIGVAIALTIGIGLQNFPEGLAVAMPLRRMGWSRLRSFWCGQLSAVAEPIEAVIGAAAVSACVPLMPRPSRSLPAP